MQSAGHSSVDVHPRAEERKTVLKEKSIGMKYGYFREKFKFKNKKGKKSVIRNDLLSVQEKVLELIKQSQILTKMNCVKVFLGISESCTAIT